MAEYNKIFNGLTRFVGTKAAYDSLDKTGKLVFAQISGATGNVAPYYLYANDTEFALNSYDQFKDLASKVVYGATGDSYISVSGSTSLTITHNNSGVTANSYNGSFDTKTSGQVGITIPTFTVDAAGHLTAAGTTTATIDASSFGLSSAMHFRGTVTSKPTETTGYNSGDVILVTGGTEAGKEFVFVGATGSTPASWVELGDESRYANKETTITGGTGLTSTGTLGSGVTISLNQDSIDALGRANSAIQGVTAGNSGVTVSTDSSTKQVTVSHATYTAAGAAAVKVGRDEFGHVTLGDALTASDITISGVTGLSGANVKEDFDQVVAKINAVDSKASKTYTVTGSASSYIVVGSSTVGNTTTFTVGATLATLGDAVGMTKNPDGTWTAASGTVSNGLVTAADVAAEIVADERVIAVALNDHESRLDTIESALTWSVIG